MCVHGKNGLLMKRSINKNSIFIACDYISITKICEEGHKTFNYFCITLLFRIKKDSCLQYKSCVLALNSRLSIKFFSHLFFSLWLWWDRHSTRYSLWYVWRTMSVSAWGQRSTMWSVYGRLSQLNISRLSEWVDFYPVLYMCFWKQFILRETFRSQAISIELAIKRMYSTILHYIMYLC